MLTQSADQRISPFTTRRAILARMADRTGALSNRRSIQVPKPTEVRVAEIWAQVLGVEQVGPHDNYFELGGHSLLAAEVFETARKQFSVALPVRALFAAPTVPDFARAIEEISLKGGGESPILRAPRPLDPLSEI